MGVASIVRHPPQVTPPGGVDGRAVALATQLLTKHHNPAQFQNSRYVRRCPSVPWLVRRQHAGHRELNLVRRRVARGRAGRGPRTSVLRQRLAVTEIPTATVTATFKTHHFSYWVYGVDGKVFETEYPGKPGCSVM